MNTDEMMDAIGKIDLKYVQEAEEYHAKKRGGSAAWYGRYKRLLPAAACLALMIVGSGVYGLLSAGDGADKSGGTDGVAMESAADAGASDGGAVENAAEEAALEDAGASDLYANAPQNNAAGERIYVNEITEMTVASYDIAGPVRTEYYSAGELEEYYGTRIVPQKLPGDLTAAAGDFASDKQGVLRGDADLEAETSKDEQMSAGAGAAGTPDAEDAASADGAETSDVSDMAAETDKTSCAAEESATGYAVGYDDEGNVVDDNNELCWQNKDGTRSLAVAARTVPAGEVVLLEQKDLEYSQIAGCEVMLTHYRDAQGADCYLALYEKGGVTVTVSSRGMTQEEVVSVLFELLAEDASYNRTE